MFNETETLFSDCVDFKAFALYRNLPVQGWHNVLPWSYIHVRVYNSIIQELFKTAVRFIYSVKRHYMTYVPIA